MRIPFNIRFVFLAVLPVFIIVYFLVYSLAPSGFRNSKTEIEFWNKRGDFYMSSTVALLDLSENKNDIHRHYTFLTNFCKLKTRDRDLIHETIEAIFGDLEKYYKDILIKNPKNVIAFYGYWKLKTYLINTEKRLEEFLEADSLEINSLYLNELRGDIFSAYNSDKSIEYYELELKSFPANKNVKIKLFKKIFTLKPSERVSELIQDEVILSEPSLYSWVRSYYFKNNIIKWLKIIPKQFIYHNDYLVILDALFVFLAWLIFFLYINIFKDIKFYILVLACFLATLATPFVITFYDIFYFTRSVDYEPNLFKENFFVGLFEESAKIIFPLIVSVIFSSRLKSPFSVMIIFTFSSLIFSTLENMLYFGNYYDISIISLRGIYSVMLHLCAGTVAAYGFILYKFQKKSIFYFLFTFSIAVIMHMFYDVIAESFVHLLNIPFVIISAFILFSIYNNLLNNSPNFNHEKEARLNKSGLVLISGLSFVILVEFISMSYRYGFFIGEATFFNSMFSYGWLILVFASPVSNFKLVKQKWSFIDLGGLKPFDNFSNEIKEINVTPVNSNAITYQLKILGTIRANSERKWYHCIQENTNEYYLINFKEEGDHFIDQNIVLFVLKAEKEIPHAFDPKSYTYLGMVYSSPVIK